MVRYGIFQRVRVGYNHFNNALLGVFLAGILLVTLPGIVFQSQEMAVGLTMIGVAILVVELLYYRGSQVIGDYQASTPGIRKDPRDQA